MYVLNELINKKQLSKKIALDETYLTYQAKGFVNQNRRGISKDKIGIACAIDEDGNYVVHTADRGRPTSSTLIDIFKNTIRPGSIVISDSQRSYHQLMDALNIKWVKIPSGEKSKDGYTLEMVNHPKFKNNSVNKNIGISGTRNFGQLYLYISTATNYITYLLYSQSNPDISLRNLSCLLIP